MKKILIIPLMLLAISCYSQKKISNMTSTSSVSSDAVIPIVQSGANYKATKAVMQSEINDSITIHRSELDNLIDSIAILRYAIDGTEPGDITPPSITSANIGDRASDTIYTTYSESLVWSTPSVSPWGVTVDDSTAVVTGVYHSGNSISFEIDSAVSYGEAVRITYTKPGSNSIQDASGNDMASFSYSVTNTVVNVTDTVDAIGWWKVNNDVTDEMSSYNGTTWGTVTYDATTKVAGSHAIDFDAIGGIDVGNVDFGDEFTIMYHWYGDADPGAQAKIILDNRGTSSMADGLAIWHGGWATDDNTVRVYTGNGTTQDLATTSTGTIQDDTWTHVTVTVDKPNGKCKIYINATDGYTTDSTCVTDFTNSGQLTTWGGSNAHTYASLGIFDDMRIFDRILTLDQINTIYNNPEEILLGDGDDPVIPPTPHDGVINICVVGNSIAAGAFPALETEYPGKYDVYELAEAGNIIYNQKDYWIDLEANNSAKIDSFDLIIIGPLGINDITIGRSYAQLVVSYDSLVAEINTNISTSCKTVMYSLIPSLGNYYLDAGEQPNIALVNTNYFDAGTPDVDLISSFWDVLTDGSDSIHKNYNQYCDVPIVCMNNRDYIHPNWLGEERMRGVLVGDIETLFPASGEYDVEHETDIDLEVYTSYNFTDATTGLQTEALAESYFNFFPGSPNHGIGGSTYDTMCYVVDDGVGNKSWRGYQYDETYGLITTTADGGGFMGYIETEVPSENIEMYLSYNFRYKDGYQSTLGGKLPGIKSSNDNTIGMPCNGFALGMSFTGDSSVYWNPTAEGAAFYWATGNMGELLPDEYSQFIGYCGDYYVTLPDGSRDYFYSRIWSLWEDGISAPFVKTPYAREEEWENLTLRVVMNSAPGVADGFFEAFLNGIFVGYVPNVELETGVDAATYMDIIKFYWFFGGGEPKNAPTREEWAEFDDIWVFTFGDTYTYTSGSTVAKNRVRTTAGTILNLPNGYRNSDGSWTKQQR